MNEFNSEKISQELLLLSILLTHHKPRFTTSSHGHSMLRISNNGLNVCHSFSGAQKSVRQMGRSNDKLYLANFISRDTIGLDLGSWITLDWGTVERIAEDHHSLQVK